MSNLPILSTTQASAGKAAAQNNAASANDEVSADAPLFGDVLANQIKGGKEDETLLKMLATDPTPAALKDVLKAETDTAGATATLPVDMLETLLPQAAAVAAQLSPVEARSDAKALGPNLTDEIGVPGISNEPKSEVKVEAKSGKETLAEFETEGLAAHAKSAAPSGKEAAIVAGASGSAAAAFSKELNLSARLDASNIQVQAQATPTVHSMMSAPAALAPVTAAVPLAVNTPLTQPQWGTEFSQKITWMATQQQQHVELHLNPAQLGPVDVVLKVSGDQATAQFTSSQAAVREAIEQSIPKLREILADNGIMLGNTTVSDQTPRDQRGEFGNQRQTAPNGRLMESPSSGVSEVKVHTVSRHNGMVDTFA